jgi:hypothetical protein
MPEFSTESRIDKRKNPSHHRFSDPSPLDLVRTCVAMENDELSSLRLTERALSTAKARFAAVGPALRRMVQVQYSDPVGPTAADPRFPGMRRRAAVGVLRHPGDGQ